MMLLAALVGAPGCKTLISKNALPNGVQKLLALISSLASSVVLDDNGRLSPVRGRRGGSILTSLHTSDSMSAVVSRNVLWRRDTKPPLLQMRQ